MCGQGCRFERFNDAIWGRVQELLPHYTRVTEANAYGGSVGTAAFECGPPGRGSIETNWSQFNPQQCRKLYTTVRDYESVRESLGNPPDFGCVAPDGAMFIGTARKYSDGGKYGVVSIRVRLNQGAGGAPIRYAGYPQMQ